MSETIVSCTVYANVYNEEALFHAAVRMAIDDGSTETDAQNRLRPDGEIDAAACWQTLIDPGVSPAGCVIIESTSE